MRNEYYIKKCCNKFEVNPRKYISVLYGELINNYNWIDNYDNIRAEFGLDPSVGFSQMKVSTFDWIETNYDGKNGINKSASREELLCKISNDSINIYYSVFYIKLIDDLYLKKFNRNPKIEVLASHYGKGIDYGKTIVENLYNIIGDSAGGFYHSDKLLIEFPPLNPQE